MKKIPLYLGIFLIMISGASVKIMSKRDPQLAKKEKVYLYLKKYQKTHKTIQLEDICWAEFHAICQPELSQRITDAELQEIFAEFQRAEYQLE